MATVLPASGRTAAVGAVLLDVGEHLLLGLRHRHAAVELVEQPGGHVHVAHEVVHLLERLGRWLDDDVHAVAEHVELEVGDQGGDLDERVGAEIQPGHLTVDPHKSVVHVVTLLSLLSVRLPRVDGMRRTGAGRDCWPGSSWVGSGSWRASSSSRTRARTSGRSAPTSCCRRASCPPWDTRCRCWRSSSGSACWRVCSPGGPPRCPPSCWWRSSSASARPGPAASRSSAAASAGEPDLRRTPPRSTPGRSPGTWACWRSAPGSCGGRAPPLAVDNVLLPA